MRLSRKLRKKLGYLTVPKAGQQAYWSRSESYRRAEDGTIPVENDGKYIWVPPKPWARRLKRLKGKAATETTVTK